MLRASDRPPVRRALRTLFAGVLFTFPLPRAAMVAPLAGSGPASLNGQSQTDDRLNRFDRSLSELDRSRIQSIPEARKRFADTFSSAAPDLQADAFRRFLAFYRDAIREIDAGFQRDKDAQRLLTLIADATGSSRGPLSALAKSTAPAASRLKTEYGRELAALFEYRECGIEFAASEGVWELQEDLDFILDSAAPLTGEYREYLAFHARESRGPVVEDAGLMISWDELGSRISRWERFAAAHPSLPETKTVIEPEIARMASWYLLGTDNSQAYDFSKKGAIDRRLLRSYSAFLRENSQSRYSDLIGRIQASLRKSEGRINGDILAYLKAAGYQTSYLEREAAKLRP